MRRTLTLVLVALPLCAQITQTSTATLAGSGYRNTSPIIEAAPGQVLVVSVQGAQARLMLPVAGAPQAPSLLATTVADFSAQLVHQRGRTPVGIYGVSQSGCPVSPVPCSPITNITLQIPFELVASQAANSFAGLELREGTRTLATIPVRPVADKVHIINSCDESLVYYSVFGGEQLTACTAAVVRPRGGLITLRNPVRPGESLVAFAYGMGDAIPSPAFQEFRPGITVQPFIMRYFVAGGPAYWAQAPDGVSLTDSKGDYQIHFTVPPLPSSPPLPACGALGVYGNVRVTVSGPHSTDSFDLCVQP